MDGRTGGCTCGKVRYRMDEPIIVNACHCRLCQRTSGSAFALNAMIEAERIEMIGESEPEVARTCSEMSDHLRLWRCRDCGTQLWGDHPMMTDNIRFVFVGTLDQGEELEPDAHFFVRSKHPWIVLPSNVPAYATLPENGGTGPRLSPESEARMAAAFKGLQADA